MAFTFQQALALLPSRLILHFTCSKSQMTSLCSRCEEPQTSIAHQEGQKSQLPASYFQVEEAKKQSSKINAKQPR